MRAVTLPGQETVLHMANIAWGEEMSASLGSHGTGGNHWQYKT